MRGAEAIECSRELAHKRSQFEVDRRQFTYPNLRSRLDEEALHLLRKEVHVSDHALVERDPCGLRKIALVSAQGQRHTVENRQRGLQAMFGFGDESATGQ